MNIVEFINNLPLDTQNIDLKNLTDFARSNNNIFDFIQHVPDLSRFTKLKTFRLIHTYRVTTLPVLPDSLERLECYGNALTQLPKLPKNLKSLYCWHNNLSELPSPLPENLEVLCCGRNPIDSLPILPESLYCFDAQGNKYNSYIKLLFGNNISFISLHNVEELQTIKNKIKVFHNCKYIIYSFKCRKQFRKLLWEKVREPKIRRQFAPENIVDILYNEIEDDDIF